MTGEDLDDPIYCWRFQKAMLGPLHMCKVVVSVCSAKVESSLRETKRVVLLEEHMLLRCYDTEDIHDTLKRAL